MNDSIIGSILNFVSDSVITMDNKGILSHITPAAGTLFGYTEEEASGKHISLLLYAT